MSLKWTGNGLGKGAKWCRTTGFDNCMKWSRVQHMKIIEFAIFDSKHVVFFPQRIHDRDQCGKIFDKTCCYEIERNNA